MSSTASSRPAGRPPLDTGTACEHLCLVIQQTGCSDSAAASTLGLSTSSLSRWKQADPSFALRLLQARQQFRVQQLEIILGAAQAERGWRAAAWLLERVFPEDYSPRASERAKFQELARAAEETSAPATSSPPSASLAPTAPTKPTDHLAPSEHPSQNSQNPPLAKPPLTTAHRTARPSHRPPPPCILSGPLLPKAA